TIVTSELRPAAVASLLVRRLGYQLRRPYLPFRNLAKVTVFFRRSVRRTTIAVASSFALDAKPPCFKASKISLEVAGASPPLDLRISRYSRTAELNFFPVKVSECRTIWRPLPVLADPLSAPPSCPGGRGGIPALVRSTLMLVRRPFAWRSSSS